MRTLLPALVIATAVIGSLSAQTMAPQERGKLLYTRGLSASGKEVTADLGKDAGDVAASLLPCVGCHGVDGRGRPEGGISPSNIRWEALTRPYGLVHSSGRSSPPYTERTLKRAVTMGFDAGGNPLHKIMPRYRLSQQDATDLVAYLKVIGADDEQGVAQDSIRVGVLLPPADRLPEMNAGVRASLGAYFRDVNDAGGVYRRRIELRFTTSQTREQVRDFLEQEHLFALVAGFVAGIEEEITSVIREIGVPMIGAVTLDPQGAVSPGVFLLDAGLTGQTDILAAFITNEHLAAPARVAIIRSNEPVSRRAAEAARRHVLKVGWSQVEDVVIPPDGFVPSAVAERVRAADVVFFLSLRGSVEELHRELGHEGVKSFLLVPGALAPQDGFTLPVSNGPRVFMAFQTLSSDRTPEALGEYSRMAEAHHLPSVGLVNQWTALASAKILVEALKRAGYELSRQKLIDSVETLRDFGTGLVHPVSYSRNQHIGTLGAHIVTIDPQSGRPVAETVWVQPE